MGALTRNTVGAIIGALGWVFLVEVAILQPLAPSLAKWLPTGAAIALTTPTEAGGTNLAPAAAALVLVAWSAVVALVASRLTLTPRAPLTRAHTANTEPPVGIEPTTFSLRVRRSTD